MPTVAELRKAIEEISIVEEQGEPILGDDSVAELRKAIEEISIVEEQGEPIRGDNLSSKKMPELFVIAKDLRVKSAQSLKKSLLVRAIKRNWEEPREEIEDVILCIHDNDIKKCGTCVKRRFCVHGRYNVSCKPCGGSRFCKHGELFANCQEGCKEERERQKQSLRLKPV